MPVETDVIFRQQINRPLSPAEHDQSIGALVEFRPNYVAGKRYRKNQMVINGDLLAICIVDETIETVAAGATDWLLLGRLNPV